MNYHILTQAEGKKTIQVLLHISVPDITNQANVNYRTAVVEYIIFSNENYILADDIVSQLPSISQAEIDDMRAGILYEVVKSYRFSKLGLTPAEKKTELDAFYTAQVIKVRTYLQSILEWWGKGVDV